MIQLIAPPAIHNDRLGLRVMSTCLAVCNDCGNGNRLFAVTDHGVLTRCFTCHDEWRYTTAPWSCASPRV